MIAAQQNGVAVRPQLPGEDRMTLFEYLAIAFGLLYSVAALRVLGGLPVAMVPQRRYFPHLLLTFILLLFIATSFWSFWSARVARRRNRRCARAWPWAPTAPC